MKFSHWTVIPTMVSGFINEIKSRPWGFISSCPPHHHTTLHTAPTSWEKTQWSIKPNLFTYLALFFLYKVSQGQAMWFTCLSSVILPICLSIFLASSGLTSAGIGTKGPLELEQHLLSQLARDVRNCVDPKMSIQQWSPSRRSCK